MPLDAPVTAAAALEINSRLPVKVDRINQPHSEDFVFSCFGMGQGFMLYVSLNSRYSRIHFCDDTVDNHVNPSPFGMLLRKYFGGSKLISVKAVPFERIIRLTFETFEELSGLTRKEIVLELTGKSSNLIITDASGTIIDLWRKVNAKPQERELSTGAKYELPSTGGRWQPITVNPEDFILLAGRIPAETPVEKFLLKHWYGLSALSVREITKTAGIAPDTACTELSENTLLKLYDSFQNWAESVKKEAFEPCCLYNREGEPVDCSAFPVRFADEGIVVKPVSSICQAINRVYRHKLENERFREAKNNLDKAITTRLEKARLKFSRQKEEAAQAERGDEWRIMGELLTSYGSQIPKGSSVAKLTNYYDAEENPELEIALNPALTVWENAQHYFKKYQKAKKGQLAIAAQLGKTQETIDYLDSIATMIQNALTPADLRLIKEELDLIDKKPGQPKNKTKKKEVPAEPRQFSTPTGHVILVGRNNLQNDGLTFKIAEPDDWWFHTQKIPGSHVILRPKPGIAVDDEALNLACQLAVYFSKARQSTKVPVDYTRRKYVKKPPGSKPGFVIYDNFKTAIITPDFQRLEVLGIQKDQN